MGQESQDGEQHSHDSTTRDNRLTDYKFCFEQVFLYVSDTVEFQSLSRFRE